MADLPQPGGGQRSQTKFIVFEEFTKMNTQAARQGLSEKELAWQENLQPIAPNNLQIVPAAAASALANLPEVPSLVFYSVISGTDYFVAFTTSGSAFAINISNGAVNNFAADGTFSSAPDLTTWQAQRALINDISAGYCTFDGTLFVQSGQVSPNLTIESGGQGYASGAVISITGGSGTGAAGIAVTNGGTVIAGILTSAGIGYQPQDVLTASVASGSGSGAVLVAHMSGFPVIGLSLGNGGSFSSPSAGTYALTFAGGGGTGAAGTATVVASGFVFTVQSVALTAQGHGYTSAPTVTLTVTGNAPTITAQLGRETVTSVTVTSGGTNYATNPPVVFSGGNPSPAATASATLSGSVISSVTLITSGSYKSTPKVFIGGGTGAVISAHVWPFIPPGSTLAIFQGRVWLGGGQLLQWTGTGASYGNVGYDDFLAADASGSLQITDADLVHAITALRSFNNYLFIMGDQSVKQIGNISLDSTGLITLFTILTLSSDQGTIFPKSCISYNRIFLFANPNGIYGVFGSTVQKLSSDCDGIFKLVDFTQMPQGAVVDLNAIHNAVFLVRYIDTLAGERSILLMFDGQRWYVNAQGSAIAAIATAASFTSDENLLYGAGVSSGGTDITQLFAQPNVAVQFKIQTAQTHHGNAVQGKRVTKAGFTASATTATNVSMTIDADTSINSNTMQIGSGFHLNGGANDVDNAPINGAGIYLGMTITGAMANMRMTNCVIEYQEATTWKGK